MFDPALETLVTLIGDAAVDSPLRPLPCAGVRTRLGFPSAAEDFEDDPIDLHHMLVRNPAATFLYRASGWSMLHAGICDGDVLVVDRSVTVKDGDIVVATWDGNQPVCKVIKIGNDRVELHSRNPHCPPVVLPAGTELEAFAVVGVARQLRRVRAP